MSAYGRETAHDEVLGRYSTPAGSQQAGTESTYPRADNDGDNQRGQVRKSVERSLQGQAGSHRNDGHDYGDEVCAGAG
jgi:hypothetical protein